MEKEEIISTFRVYLGNANSRKYLVLERKMLSEF